MTPRVSVVMPSYNHAPFVAEAIESVLSQSFQDFEIVVTDDASTDATVKIIRSFDDPRIDVQVFDRNRGAAVALNASVRRSRGAFVSYLASDDYFLAGKLARQLAFLDANPDVLAVFGMPRNVDERGQPIDRTLTSFADPFAEPPPSRGEWLREFFFFSNSLCHPTAMIRRAAFDVAGLFDPRLASLPDFDMWVRLCMHGEIRVLAEEFTAFRVLENERNMSAGRPDAAMRDMFEFFQILKHYRDMPLDFARQVFAEDLIAHGIATDRPYPLWLAEVALHGKRPAHSLFALELMFDATASDEADHKRLIDLSGILDVFAVGRSKQIEAADAELRRRLSMAPPNPTAAEQRPGTEPRPGRNDPCPCGSGKKYKRCHGRTGG